MGCLIVLVGLFGPRVGTLVLWLFTDRMTNAYENGIVPVVGFVFLPWTTFLYGAVQGGGGEVGPLGIAMIVIGVIADLATLIGGFGEYRKRGATPSGPPPLGPSSTATWPSGDSAS